ncbi:hypothetical protein ABK249_12015 [Neorhizobium sp. Rsf11]|uniref:Ribbon-helix-helix protein CopG domain-containing protein n=1 Tax=Neorhizobium phenanthreniclasticum TaxID=3157917 RepID=A0ABV0M1D8_9HYPH
MARPKLGETETERMQIKITAAEIEAIDEWRFANRVPSRSEAVRRLCKIGLLVDQELEQAVDIASDGVTILNDQALELIGLTRRLTGPETSDVLFSRQEMSDVLELANEHADVASEGLKGLHKVLVTIYNAIAEIANARSYTAGVEALEKVIDAANAAVDESIARRNERKENRYIGIWSVSRTPEERAEYEALPEEEKEAFLAGELKRLEQEEEQDLEGFKERYNIPDPFWTKAGWINRLQKLDRQNKGESK